ncbi:M20/M25/M40 family metallo-hydrolase [Alkalicoccus urumqiensis]|uniref:Amino acid degradation protein n=1 Tax=Alkalicoccus urumqiensis TaxID=1548213 RepID=A0A2P6MJZ9_ALKUR|nr:M20/M25/M40 family metallo-hydrolase [Alkalicoccus urumqiensis]PRO66585.1 amino acid degradation protein [Alkalicoccus urumqiensis]
MLWNRPEDLEELLCELVGWESRTFSQGERDFPVKLQEKLKLLPYFRENRGNIRLWDADKGRRSLTALYRHPDPDVTETVVLLSHFDTVQTEEYGRLEPFAFDPPSLTHKLEEENESLPHAAREDLLSGQYYFGRGTMDMKMGLALHMHLVEKAIEEAWRLNLLLVTVPDEEVDSAGMRTAVPGLVEWKEAHNLSYSLFLNSEPSFTQHPGDETHYIYTGSMGKIMPAALFVGKESHVGEPLSGITATYISSYVTQEMEWNPAFREQDMGEETPLPVSLQSRDLKLEYSTQTPYRAASLYNVFTLKQDAAQVMDTFEGVVQSAVQRCNEDYEAVCRREEVDGVGRVRVLRCGELQAYVQEKADPDVLEEAERRVLENEDWDDREKSIRLAGEWMLLCPELAPAAILFFAPPYYPSVQSADDERIQEAVEAVKNVGVDRSFDVRPIHYFNGICDLSYVNYDKPERELEAYRDNTPLWNRGYDIPFEAMRGLKAPVLNVGPFGKDPHQRTERLHKQNAFVHTPQMLHQLLNVWQKQPQR